MMKLPVRLFLPALLAASILTPSPSEAGFGLYALSNGYDNSGSISAIDALGNATTIATIPIGGIGPTSMTIDSSGNFYVAGVTGTVEKFSSTGQDLGAVVSGLPYLRGIAVDQSGNIYVSEVNTGIIEKFSATGQDLGIFASGFSNTSRIALDSSGNLYVTNGYSVDKFSATGQSIGDTNLNGVASSLAFDSTGDVYISEYSLGANGFTSDIVKFSSTGQSLGTFASTGGNITSGMAFDSSGNLYASYYNDNGGPADVIEKFASTGQDLGNFSSGGYLDLAFGPQSMASVPEPASLIMTGLGLAAVAGFVRLRRIRALLKA